MTRLAPLFALCFLAACGSGPSDGPPAKVTPGEARALDDAAEMIGAQRLPQEAAAPAAGQAGK